MERKDTVTPYETIFIVHPDQGGKVKEYTDRFKKIIEGLDGTVSHVDEWGLMDLAYRIEKQAKGHYVLVRYQSSARVVEELERNLKLSDGILRYLTVRLDEDAMAPARPSRIRSRTASPTERSPVPVRMRPVPSSTMA